ncbi:hypothetical protein BANRA_04494 [Klebsiella pneumoniae]|nr:hypothetical protein BANRA_04494 [Klebsiella pneumoniae]
MTEENEFILSERLLFIHLDNISEGLKLAHVYYKLIDCFIRTGAKGRNSTYFKTFMKVIANKKRIPTILYIIMTIFYYGFMSTIISID